MRLLIITQVLDSSHPVLGFFHEWVREFAARVDEVHVICLQEGQHDMPKNVHVYSLGKERGGGRLRYLARFLSLIFKLRSKYDTVFVHMNVEYVIIAGLWWRFWGKKVLLWYTHKMVHWRLRLATLFAHEVLTASVESFRLPTRKLHVLGHGITCAGELRTKPAGQKRAWITAGRIAASKRIAEMIALVKEMRAHGHEITLDIFGGPGIPADEQYLELLKKQIRNAALTDVVFLCGPVAQNVLLERLPSYDVFINFSATGSLDKAVLESLCAGVPVITTNEAFAEHVPVEFLTDTSYEHVRSALLNADARDPKQLRQYVLAHHSLPVLIDRITRLCSHG